jgi:hypothetical protein
MSLLLTLIATPVIYTWFDDAAHSRLVRWIGLVVSFPFRMINRIFERTPAAAAPQVAAPRTEERQREAAE